MYRQNKQIAKKASAVCGSQLTADKLSAFDEYLSSQNNETISLEGAAASVQGTHFENQSQYEVQSQGPYSAGADKVPSLMYPPKLLDLDQHQHHQKSDRGIMRSGGSSSALKLKQMPTTSEDNRYQSSSSASDLPSTSSFSRAGGIEIDEATVESLRQAFETFVPVCEPQSTIRGVEIRNVDPSMMKRQYLNLGLDQEQPSMYQMICQMERDCKDQGKLYLNFDEFMDFAIQFFSQRDHEKGLRYIFELFDSEKKGYITYSQFKQIFAYLGFNVSDDDMKRMFRRASSNQTSIGFKDFAKIMKQE